MPSYFIPIILAEKLALLFNNQYVQALQEPQYSIIDIAEGNDIFASYYS